MRSGRPKGWALAVALVFLLAASDIRAMGDVGGTVVSVVSGEGGVGTVVKIDIGSSDGLKDGHYGWVQEKTTPFAYIHITSLGEHESLAEVTMNDSIYGVYPGRQVFFRVDIEALARQWYEKGYAYYNSGSYGDALDCVDKAITLKPDEYSWYGIRGHCYGITGAYDKAVADMNIYVEHFPNDGWGYRIRGFAYDSMGESGKALSDFRRSCDLGDDLGCKKLNPI